MNLASPWMLLGLLALAVPVWLHLTQRQDHDEKKFPSLMFLRQVPFREKSRLTLRDLALLLLRVAAVVLLVLAFAGPNFFTTTDEDAARDTSDTVILIDSSYSMDIDGRFEQALEQTRLQIDAMKSDASVAIVLFDERVRVLQDFNDDAAAMKASLNGLETSSLSTDLELAFETASQMLARRGGDKRRVLLISDLQASAVEKTDRLRMAPDTELEIVRLNDDAKTPIANLSVISVQISEAADGLSQVAVVRVRNTGSEDIQNANVNVEINGELQTAQSVSIQPDGEARVEFELVLANDRPTTLTVMVEDDDLIADNHFYAIGMKARRLNVLIVEPDRPRPNQSLYLERAMGLNELNSDTKTVRVSDVSREDLGSRDIVVLNDVAITRRIGEQLGALFKADGGLLTIAGKNTNSGWRGARDDLGTHTATDTQTFAPLRLAVQDHPLSMIKALRSGGSLSGLEIKSLVTPSSAEDARMIVSTTDGKPVLSARAQSTNAAGRELFLGTTVDPAGSSLALEPGFVALVKRSMNYLANRHEANSWINTGDSIDLATYLGALPGARTNASSSLAVIEAPDDREHVIERSNSIYVPELPGLHELHTGNSSGTPLALAVNVSRDESNLTSASDADIRQRLLHDPLNQNTQKANTILRDRDGNAQRKRDLPWILLALAALALVLESLIANRLTVRRAGARTQGAL